MYDRKLSPAGARKKESLLNAAEQILLSKGVHTPLRTIAAGTGVSVGHLQHYFPNRSDLISAVLERYLSRALDDLAQLTGGKSPSQATPELIAGIVLETQVPHTVVLFSEIWALAARDEAVRAVVFSFYQEFISHVAASIHNFCPHLSNESVRARAQTAVSLLIGSGITRSGIGSYRTPATDAVTIETVKALWENSL